MSGGWPWWKTLNVGSVWPTIFGWLWRRLMTSIGKMTRDDFNALPPPEQRHYNECAVCGQMVDKRQLDDVLFHEKHRQFPDIQGGEWQQP